MNTIGDPSLTLGLSIDTRGATGTGGSVSVLSPGSGSVVPGGVPTVAVFAPMVPPAGAVPLTVMVTALAPPTPTVAARLTSPVPDPVPQLEVPDAAQLQLTPVNCGGTVSAIVAPTAMEGPALVTTSR